MDESVMDENRRQSILKPRTRFPIPDVPGSFGDEDTVTTTMTRSRRVSFGRNMVKEFMIGSSVCTQAVQMYEQSSLSSSASDRSDCSGPLDLALNSTRPEPSTTPCEVQPTAAEHASRMFTESCISIAKSVFQDADTEYTAIIIGAKPNEDRKNSSCMNETDLGHKSHPDFVPVKHPDMMFPHDPSHPIDKSRFEFLDRSVNHSVLGGKVTRPVQRTPLAPLPTSQWDNENYEDIPPAHGSFSFPPGTPGYGLQQQFNNSQNVPPRMGPGYRTLNVEKTMDLTQPARDESFSDDTEDISSLHKELAHLNQSNLSFRDKLQGQLENSTMNISAADFNPHDTFGEDVDSPLAFGDNSDISMEYTEPIQNFLPEKTKFGDDMEMTKHAQVWVPPVANNFSSLSAGDPQHIQTATSFTKFGQDMELTEHVKLMNVTSATANDSLLPSAENDPLANVGNFSVISTGETQQIINAKLASFDERTKFAQDMEITEHGRRMDTTCGNDSLASLSPFADNDDPLADAGNYSIISTGDTQHIPDAFQTDPLAMEGNYSIISSGDTLHNPNAMETDPLAMEGNYSVISTGETQHIANPLQADPLSEEGNFSVLSMDETEHIPEPFPAQNSLVCFTTKEMLRPSQDMDVTQPTEEPAESLAPPEPWISDIPKEASAPSGERTLFYQEMILTPQESAEIFVANKSLASSTAPGDPGQVSAQRTTFCERTTFSQEMILTPQESAEIFVANKSLVSSVTTESSKQVSAPSDERTVFSQEMILTPQESAEIFVANKSLGSSTSGQVSAPPDERTVFSQEMILTPQESADIFVANKSLGSSPAPEKPEEISAPSGERTTFSQDMILTPQESVDISAANKTIGSSSTPQNHEQISAPSVETAFSQEMILTPQEVVDNLDCSSSTPQKPEEVSAPSGQRAACSQEIILTPQEGTDNLANISLSAAENPEGTAAPAGEKAQDTVLTPQETVENSAADKTIESSPTPENPEENLASLSEKANLSQDMEMTQHNALRNLSSCEKPSEEMEITQHVVENALEKTMTIENGEEIPVFLHGKSKLPEDMDKTQHLEDPVEHSIENLAACEKPEEDLASRSMEMTQHVEEPLECSTQQLPPSEKPEEPPAPEPEEMEVEMAADTTLSAAERAGADNLGATDVNPQPAVEAHEEMPIGEITRRESLALQAAECTMNVTGKEEEFRGDKSVARDCHNSFAMDISLSVPLNTGNVTMQAEKTLAAAALASNVHNNSFTLPTMNMPEITMPMEDMEELPAPHSVQHDTISSSLPFETDAVSPPKRRSAGSVLPSPPCDVTSTSPNKLLNLGKDINVSVAAENPIVMSEPEEAAPQPTEDIGPVVPAIRETKEAAESSPNKITEDVAEIAAAPVVPETVMPEEAQQEPLAEPDLTNKENIPVRSVTPSIDLTDNTMGGRPIHESTRIINLARRSSVDFTDMSPTFPRMCDEFTYTVEFATKNNPLVQKQQKVFDDCTYRVESPTDTKVNREDKTYNIEPAPKVAAMEAMEDEYTYVVEKMKRLSNVQAMSEDKGRDEMAKETELQNLTTHNSPSFNENPAVSIVIPEMPLAVANPQNESRCSSAPASPLPEPLVEMGRTMNVTPNKSMAMDAEVDCVVEKMSRLSGLDSSRVDKRSHSDSPVPGERIKKIRHSSSPMPRNTSKRILSTPQKVTTPGTPQKVTTPVTPQLAAANDKRFHSDSPLPTDRLLKKIRHSSSPLPNKKLVLDDFQADVSDVSLVSLDLTGSDSFIGNQFPLRESTRYAIRKAFPEAVPPTSPIVERAAACNQPTEQQPKAIRQTAECPETRCPPSAEPSAVVVGTTSASSNESVLKISREVCMKTKKALENQGSEEGCIWKLTQFEACFEDAGCVVVEFPLLARSLVMEIKFKSDSPSPSVTSIQMTHKKANRWQTSIKAVVNDFGFETLSGHIDKNKNKLDCLKVLPHYLDFFNSFAKRLVARMSDALVVLVGCASAELKGSVLSFELCVLPTRSILCVDIDLLELLYPSPSPPIVFRHVLGGRLDEQEIRGLWNSEEPLLQSFIRNCFAFTYKLESPSGYITKQPPLLF